MDVQEILLIAVFIAAIWYVSRMIYRNLQSKDGCSSGCGKCGVNFSDADKSKSA